MESGHAFVLRNSSKTTHNVVHKKFEVFLLHGHVESAGVDPV